MVTLYITRHGQTQWNTQKRMQGWFDSPLTTVGIEAASALGKRLANISFNAVYASPSGRTVDTAKLICKDRQLPIFFKQQLKEIHVGEWQGLTSETIQSTYPTQYDAYYNDPENYYSVEGECFQEVLDRSTSLIEEIISKYAVDDTVLIVTHAVVKKLLIAHFSNLSISNVWDPPFIHGTSLTIVHIDANKKIVIEMVGDTSHVANEALIY